MKDPFFQLASDFMAVGPAGTSNWEAVNPALAARLGLEDPAPGQIQFGDPMDPSRILTRDGSCLTVDWAVREENGLAYWVGRERKLNLVHELHHRLKNNLQFIVSLLGFQSARLTDPEARSRFAKAESRIRAVARLHESAYATSDLSQVEFGGYLRQLVADLTAGEPVSATVEAVEVALPMEHAVPLALIAHELVSNALEHSGSPAIGVSLRYEDITLLCLNIKDNGRGMANAQPAGGLELVGLFVEQLHGALNVHATQGVDVSVSFPLSDD